MNKYLHKQIVFYFYLFLYKIYSEKFEIFTPFILDDYISEIDNKNCSKLFEYLTVFTKNKADIFISMIDEESRLKELALNKQIIYPDKL